MNKHSMLDRDNTELFIMSEQDEKDWLEFLQSDDYIEWQEQVYKQEILKRGGGDEKFGDIKDSHNFYGVITFYNIEQSIIHSEIFNISAETIEIFNIDMGQSSINELLRYNTLEDLLTEYIACNKVNPLPITEWEYEEIELLSEQQYNNLMNG